MAKYDDLLKEYRSLAKKADQRLVRLEKYSEQEHYKGVKKYSYARAMHDIEKYSGEGAARFNTKPPENTNQLQAKINDIKHFLESVTSTKKGITSVYEKRAKSINEGYTDSKGVWHEGYHTGLTWEDFATFYESDLYKKLDSQYGSATLVKSLGVLKSIGNIKPKDIEKILEENKKVSDDEVVDEITKSLLKQGITSKDLFGK